MANSWKDSLTLDERIKLDLTELYNSGEITAAKELDGVIASENGEPSFSVKGLPGHFTGKRDAKTVVVMLNPGRDVKAANDNVNNEIQKHKIDTSSLDRFISSYNEGKMSYGDLDSSRPDYFDIKQALFLYSWEKSGIDIPKELIDEDKYLKVRLEAKRNVLMQKLQLELIPYASRKFSPNKKRIGALIPLIDTLFNEIFSCKRNYVIFCGSIFESIFKLYNQQESKTYTIEGLNTAPTKKVFDGYKGHKTCRAIAINDNKGGMRKAIIAHTFAQQGLSGMLMKLYGDWCYQIFTNKFGLVK